MNFSKYLLFLGCLLTAGILAAFTPRTFDGTGFGEFDDSEKPDYRRGVTLIFVGRYQPELAQKKSHVTTFFYKQNEFVFELLRRRPYFVLRDAGGDWNYYKSGIHAAGNFVLPENDKNFHHWCVTINRYVEPDQGTDYTEVKIYQDGAAAGGKRYDHHEWLSSTAKIAYAGINSSKDKIFDPQMWNFPGKVINVKKIDRVLSESEIRKDVLNTPEVIPNFPVPRQLTAQQRKKLTPPSDARPEVLARYSALNNAAMGNLLNLDAIVNGKVKIHSFKGTDSVLTLLDDGNRVQVASFYDLRNKRELLYWQNAFFEAELVKRDKSVFTVAGNNPKLTARLSKVKSSSQGTSFAISGALDKFSYTMNFTYTGDRLEYTLRTVNSDKDARMANVVFPCWRFNAFAGNKDTLLVPIMSGVEYPQPCKSAVIYSDDYPRGRASLQMGAYYDDRSGIFFATADPRARAKNLTFSCDSDTVNGNFSWTVPYREKFGKNEFDSGKCTAVAEIFTGSWYDAGLRYRAMVQRMQAPWWRETLPETDTPQWFRDTCLWIGRWQSDKDYHRWHKEYKRLEAWRKYVGQGPEMGVHFYKWCGHFTRDWPYNPANPYFVIRTRIMQNAGYRVMPYINGRIWEEHDLRDEDYRYTKVGLPAAVKLFNGTPSPEPYGDFMFRVICPGTQTYAEEMNRECDNVLIYGADGAYIDQIGAAASIPCHDPHHGHLLADPDLWYMQGHRKVYTDMKKRWKKEFPQGITMGEDISEAQVGVLDGGLTWRWMYNGQVPLFQEIYSGRTQTCGNSWGEVSLADGDDASAGPAKLTFQILNGQQLGWFSINYLSRSDLHDLRVLAKQYVHLRYALLDFFNCGMMSRPPRFAEKQIPVSRIWGRQGTSKLATPPLEASAWELKGARVVMVANSDDKPASNKLVMQLPTGKMRIYRSSGGVEDLDFAGGEKVLELTLQPLEFITVLANFEAVPEVKKRLDKAFEVIAKAPQDDDLLAKRIK